MASLLLVLLWQEFLFEKTVLCYILATVGCMNTAPHTTDILVLPQPSSAPMGLNCTDKLNFTCITSLEFYANEVNGDKMPLFCVLLPSLPPNSSGYLRILSQ
mgnify:CR=1 FL=1